MSLSDGCKEGISDPLIPHSQPMPRLRNLLESCPVDDDLCVRSQIRYIGPGIVEHLQYTFRLCFLLCFSRRVLAIFLCICSLEPYPSMRSWISHSQLYTSEHGPYLGYMDDYIEDQEWLFGFKEDICSSIDEPETYRQAGAA